MSQKLKKNQQGNPYLCR